MGGEAWLASLSQSGKMTLVRPWPGGQPLSEGAGARPLLKAVLPRQCHLSSFRSRRYITSPDLIGPAADLNRPHSLLSNSPPPRKSSSTPVIRLFFFCLERSRSENPQNPPSALPLLPTNPDPPPPTASQSHELINTIHNPLSSSNRPPRNIADACLPGLA